MQSHQGTNINHDTHAVVWHAPFNHRRASVTTSIDESKSTSCQSSEKKEEVSESHLVTVHEDETLSSISTPLYYLKNLDKKKRDELTTLFSIPIDELEDIIKNYHHHYWFYRFEYAFAMSLNLLELVYLARTSNEGVNAIVSYFSPTLQLPNQLVYGIGIPWALTDVLLYTFVFSPEFEAIKSTILYATRTPLHQEIYSYLQHCYDHPKRSLLAISCWMVNQAVLLNCNLTESLTDIIDILWVFEKLPPILYWGIIVSVLYLGNLYYSKYANIDYYEGIKFWLNEDKLPYLYQEIARKNISMPLQILLQGISTIGLDCFPFYFYLAIAAEEELGGWTPPLLTSLLAGIHGLCVLYPASYFHYMEHTIEITQLLHEHHADFIKQLLKHQHRKSPLTNAALEKAIAAEIEQMKTDHIAKTTENQPSFTLFKQTPLILIPILIKAALGGYLGYVALYPLFFAIANESTSSTLASSLIGASLFSSGLYKIEKYRLMTELTANELKQIDEDHSDSTADSTATPSNCLKSTTRITASILNVGSGLSNATSIVGTATRLFGTKKSYALPSVALFAMERMSNSIIYNMNKVESTFSHAVSSAHHTLTSMSCRLFNTKKPAVLKTEPTSQITMNPLD